MYLARQIARWQPAGRRMKPDEKLAWRRDHLESALKREGIAHRRALDDVLVDALLRESRRSSHARYVRAYGSGQ
jgi:hypothetical protein